MDVGGGAATLGGHNGFPEYSSGSDASLSQRGGGRPPSAEPPRKLVILGLPYYTADETLRTFFAAFGEVEEAVVMREHATGRSRGFGFVTFVTSADAARVAGNEYTVDGRRCEAKFALPRGETAAQRVTRIFVAKLPPSVGEEELRAYFAEYGDIQDVYMPKDASKQARRGIGFVTFASPDSVERVMRRSHVVGGQELVVDKAAPKLKEPVPSLTPGPGMYRSSHAQAGSQLSPLSADQLSALGMGNGVSSGGQHLLGGYGPHGRALPSQQLLGGSLGGSASSLGAYDTFPPLNSDENGGELSLHGLGLVDQNGSNGGLNALHNLTTSLSSTQNAASVQLALAHLARAQQAAQLGISLGYDGRGGQLGAQSGGVRAGNPTGSASSLTDLDRLYGASGMGGLPQHLLQHSSDGHARYAGGAGPSHGGGPGLPPAGEVLGTNRIFIGKLSKDVTEADIKDYCSTFGYVLDVYIPRDKTNKREHRGFAFATYETEAAVERILSCDEHSIAGCPVAVDRALPRTEESSSSMMGVEQGGDGDAALGMAGLGLGPHASAMGPARHLDRPRYMYHPY